MLNVTLPKIKSELKNAIASKDHPFRYGTLATHNDIDEPVMRTVVLRSIDDQFNLLFYTDSRSKKTTHIQQQNKVGLLFFDSKKFVQIAIQATATIITNTKILDSFWKEIPEKSKNDYRVTQVPGSTIQNPKDLRYYEKDYFFSAIQIIPYQIEYLKLGRTYHERITFQKQDNHWKKTYLVP